MAHHFRIHRVVNTAVEQRRQALKIADKGTNEAIGFFRGSPAANPNALISTQRLLDLIRRETLGLA